MSLMTMILLLNLSHVFWFLPAEGMGKGPKNVVRDQEVFFRSGGYQRLCC